MKKIIYNLKKIKIILILSLIGLFFIINANIINYGLPFFQQEDETTFLKGTISYLSFITGIKRELTDPFFGPLINLIFTLIFLFFNEVVLNFTSFSNLKLKIYSDPSILIFYGRYCSLLATSFCLFILYLIFKKLKINFIIYFPIIVSLAFSTFMLPLSLFNGKNSYYLLFFLLQLYFFIKYYFKIEKFEKKSYLILSFLGALAWGINYWSSIVSIYGILILHFKKFKFKNLQNFVNFILVFFLIGLLPSFFLGDIFFLDYFIRTNGTEGAYSNLIFNDIYEKFKLSFSIIFNSEKILFIFLILFIFCLFSKLKNRKIILILSLLFIEPIIILAIGGYEIIPQLRYFSGSICLIFILSALIVKDILEFKNSKVVLVLFIIINLYIVLEKGITYIKVNNLVTANHSFINFFDNNKNNNSQTLHLISGLDTRKNLKNLILYKKLHENGIIQNKLFEKDNYNFILKKIEIEKDINLELKNKKTLNLNVFSINLFNIKNFDIFFEEVRKDYKYVSIQENGFESFELYNYIKTNFDIVSANSNKKNRFYNDGLRDVIKFLYNGGAVKQLDNFVLGNNYSLYKLN